MKTMKKVAAIICMLLLLFSMTGCGKLQISREIAKVDGQVVTKAEYLYYLENVKEQMLSESGTQDSESFWNAEIDGKKASEAAKNKALEEMLRVEIACVKAAEKGLSVPESSLAQIRTMVKSTDAEQKAQVDALKEVTGLNDEQLIDLLTKTMLTSVYASDISANDPAALVPTKEEINAAYQQEYVHVKHILIGNTEESDGTATEVTTEEDPAAAAEAYQAAQKAKAEDVLKKAKAGANFDSLVKEYGEDPGMTNNPEGYTFTTGSMVAEFEDASFALAVGEISDLVETSYGWHIIKKYPLPTQGTDYDAAIESITANLSQDKYNAILDSYKSDLTIEIHQNVVDNIKVK
ncbi:MAG: hypothetical protein E7393_01765 [Ruminococcaceae bacterium]|nr:hypothetical protein [Oscillospiraceae bacterium]